MAVIKPPLATIRSHLASTRRLPLRALARLATCTLGGLSWRYRIEPLKAAHIPEAAQLLAREFAQREPLCKGLGIEASALRDFFAAMCRKVYQQGLSFVAREPNGAIAGVVIIQDDEQLFDPSHDLGAGATLPAAVDEIGRLLAKLTLPEASRTAHKGRIYYCELLAVSRSVQNRHLAGRLMVVGFAEALKRGYRLGYAKVTNQAVIKIIRRLEQRWHYRGFAITNRLTPSDHCPHPKHAWRHLQDPINLVLWHH